MAVITLNEEGAGELCFPRLSFKKRERRQGGQRSAKI
jgi:hypothetical protein